MADQFSRQSLMRSRLLWGEMTIERLCELTQTQADQVKAFLLETPLDHPIRLAFPAIPMLVNIDFVAARDGDPEWRDFYGADWKQPITYRGTSGSLYLLVCQWSRPRRLHAVHIVLGSEHRQLDQRFCQIEMSDCLTDGKNVYLVKSTKGSGAASIRRLRKCAPGTTFSSRVQMLIDRLGASVLKWQGKELMVVAEIPVQDMVNNPRKLFPNVMRQLLRYAGEVETLRLGEG